MTLFELKKRIEDAIEEYGRHPIVTLAPAEYHSYIPIRAVDFDICVNCETDEEEIDLEFRT